MTATAHVIRGQGYKFRRVCHEGRKVWAWTRLFVNASMTIEATPLYGPFNSLSAAEASAWLHFLAMQPTDQNQRH